MYWLLLCTCWQCGQCSHLCTEDGGPCGKEITMLNEQQWEVMGTFKVQPEFCKDSRVENS